MAVETKKVNQLPIIEEMAENAHILIEDGGMTKRIPQGKAIPSGVVKSVNGEVPDENGNVEVPAEIPETTEANMQLVTDANGEKVWAERTHWMGQTSLVLSLSPSHDHRSSVEDKYTGGLLSYDPDQVAISNAIFKDAYDNTPKSGKWVYYWDGVRHEKDASTNWPVMWYVDDEHLYKVIISGYDMYIEYRDEQDHTFEWELINPDIKKLDERYIPDAIPRKTDLPNIPETSTPYQQLVTGADGVAKWEERLAYRQTVSGETLLPEQTITFAPSNFFETRANGQYYNHSNELEMLAEGDVCIVTFDGVEYECAAWKTGGPPYLGNGSIVGQDGGGDEPFVVCTGSYGIEIPVENVGDHIVSIRRADTEFVKTISPEFLPADVGGGGGLDVSLVNLEAHMNFSKITLLSATCSKTYHEIMESVGKKPLITTIAVTTYYEENGEMVNQGITECHVATYMAFCEDHIRIPVDRLLGQFRLYSDNNITYVGDE